MKLKQKVFIPLSLIFAIMLGGCGKPSLDGISTKVDVVAYEFDMYYTIEYIFDVQDKKGHYDELAYFITFEDEKMKALFGEEVPLLTEANGTEAQFRKVHQSTTVRFNKLVSIPKGTYDSLSEAKAAAEKIKYRITDGQVIQTYAK